MKPLLFAAVLVAAISSSRAAFAVETADRPAPSAARRSIWGLFGGGAGMTNLFGISSYGKDVHVGLGVEKGALFIPVLLNAEFGKTGAGLGTGEITLAGSAQGIVGRARFGGGVGLGYAWIDRAASSSESHIGMFVLDAFALATVDLFELQNHGAVYIGIRPGAGLRWGDSFFAWGHGTLAWRGTAMAGLRF